MKLLREYAFNMPSPPTKNFWVDGLHEIHCMEGGANEKSARKVIALERRNERITNVQSVGKLELKGSVLFGWQIAVSRLSLRTDAQKMP